MVSGTSPVVLVPPFGTASAVEAVVIVPLA